MKHADVIPDESVCCSSVRLCKPAVPHCKSEDSLTNLDESTSDGSSTSPSAPRDADVDSECGTPCTRHLSVLQCDIDEDEPLLQEPVEKNYVLHVGEHPDVRELHCQQRACFWVPEAIDQATDAYDWQTKLNDDERHFLSHVLAFFASADGIVNENLLERFTREVKVKEVQVFYTYQAMMEDIHAEVYTNLIENMITKDKGEVDRLCDAIQSIPCIHAKAMWAKQYMEGESPFVHRLVAFAIVEGLFFSGCFCAIFWIRKRGILPGLCQSNEYIARDEGMHCDFACLLYRNYVKHKMSQEDVARMMGDAVAVEKEFVVDSLSRDDKRGVELIGMNAALMSDYIEFVADRLLFALGHEKIYNTSNPFPGWMDMISYQGKTNFFERRVTEYQIAGAMGSVRGAGGAGGGSREFSTEVEF